MEQQGESVEVSAGDFNGTDEKNKGTAAGSSDSATDNNSLASRDPFFAFIPQVGKWGFKILFNETKTVANGVTGAPSFLKGFLGDTYTFYRENPKILYKEIISGFTVAIMQVPESIAFSFVAGVPPLSGLQATWWMAFITGILGGKPGMISGAAGALAVVVTRLTASDGVLAYLSYPEKLKVLYMTMFVCGIFQIGFAIFRLAKLVRLIPETGMIGFMNGLAIIIFMAQLPAFQFCDDEPLFIDCTVEQRKWLTFQEQPVELCLVLVHVAICMAIMQFFPKVPKIGKLIPASLMGLLVGTLIEWTLFRKVFGVPTRVVEETSTIAGAPPQFDWPALPETNKSETISTMLVYAIQLAAIGAVESVLTLQACNEITDTVPKIADSNQECFAQGLANLVCGLFQAMGGDAMIGQSTINIMNGARHRVSSTMSGIFMLLFTLVLSPFIKLLPIATLTGVLFIVVISTFQWKTFVILRYGRLSDSLAILLVTIVAVFTNLAIAIAAGIVLSALVHAWDSGAHVEADVETKDMIINGERVNGVKYVHIRGAIFFSSTRKFVNMFHISDDPDTIILDFKDALIIDHSAVAAIQGLAHRYGLAGKLVILSNIKDKCVGRMHRTHGNRKMLQSQLSHDVKDVELQDLTVNEKSTEGSVHNLQELKMFKTGIGGVQKELETLATEEEKYSVQTVKKDN
mmetsp:Transcript_2833/g.7776  ORF Transcript_2833/g.7776 Transcript_2833/m.7776 type:complete len:688 (+) Transcript_2833:189-2252(+)|eukprot:CAMPEP_0197183534 /NCGR_PEP_ID=MMETSP1423-20130617/7868_1 /TAXON_ID=476441 /ORGANISM="Pseudo-nitzschia heimii, Strain UNC1101" /LENGTH=687 /DNA_ID=CAMNT_0042634119 /DNA_START=127 /DNA_END=2190 /DNA_ORIENTATION=+